MVAPLVVAKLDEPINVTVVPPVTVEEGETVATATGADVVGLLLLSMIIQRFDCLSICLPLPILTVILTGL
jgi:hypothetical protein